MYEVERWINGAALKICTKNYTFFFFKKIFATKKKNCTSEWFKGTCRMEENEIRLCGL